MAHIGWCGKSKVTDEFIDWCHGLTDEQQIALTDRVDLLAERLPDLGRPVVDRISGSRHHNMKELRASQVAATSVPLSGDRGLVQIRSPDSVKRLRQGAERA